MVMKPLLPRPTVAHHGFTLVELLTVIAIIIILMGLLFPTINVVRNQAKSAQAKTDATSVVSAVKAYYTEYGRYPVPSAVANATQTDYTYDDNGSANNFNAVLMGILTADTNNPTHSTAATPPAGSWSISADNPRQIVFLEGTVAKSVGGYGIQQTGGTANGNITYARGEFIDPWGKQYRVRIDIDYDGSVRDPEDDSNLLRNPVLAWSCGKDNTHVYNSPNNASNKDNATSYK